MNDKLIDYSDEELVGQLKQKLKKGEFTPANPIYEETLRAWQKDMDWNEEQYQRVINAAILNHVLLPRNDAYWIPIK